MKREMTQYHVAVTAEAFAAALFARHGCDVSVQYGANQPGYDLVIARGERLLRVSVKGSQDGSWGVTQSYKSGRSYHQAADYWLHLQSPTLLFCYVQFAGVKPTETPRIYLAWPHEIAQLIKESSGGRGGTILHEYKAWGLRAHGYGTVEQIPDTWRFSEQRLAHVLAEAPAVI